MSTTEIQSPPSPPAAFDRPASERPIFVAEGDRRARWLARLGRAAAVLVALWLVALLAGALGFGRLPGVPYLGPGSHNAHHAVTPQSSRPPAPTATPRNAAIPPRGGRRAASAAASRRARAAGRRNAGRGGAAGGSTRIVAPGGGSGARPSPLAASPTVQRRSGITSPPSTTLGRSVTNPVAGRVGGPSRPAPSGGRVGSPGHSGTAPGQTKAAARGGSSRSAPPGRGSRSTRP